MAGERTLYPSASLANWSEAKWTLIDGTPQTEAKPITGDIVLLTEYSPAAIALNESSAVGLAGFSSASYTGTLAMGAFSIDVDVGSTLLGGVMTVSAGGGFEVGGALTIAATATIPAGMTFTLNGTGAVTLNSKSLRLLTVNTAGTHTMASKLFATTLGIAGAGTTFNGATLGADIAGNIIWSAGAWTNTGTVTQTDTGNVSLGDYTNIVTKLVLGAAGKTSTLTASSYCKAFAYGAGTVALGTNTLQLRGPAGNDYWTDGAGSVTSTTGKVNVYQSNALTQSTPVTIAARLDVAPNPGYSHTFSGGINISGYDLYVTNSAGGNPAGVDMAAGALACRDIVLGHSATRLGKIDFGEGTHSIRSLLKGHVDAITNECNFASAFINLSGTIDGAGIVISNTDVRIYGGTVSNCPSGVTPSTQCFRTINGSGNDPDSVHFHWSFGGLGSPSGLPSMLGSRRLSRARVSV